MRIVVANAPHLDRQTVVALLTARRPHHEVVACTPGRLAAALRRRAPDLVIGSELITLVQTRAPAWLLLYPGGANLGVFQAGGRRTVLDNITVDDLLACLDRVAAEVDGRAGGNSAGGPGAPAIGSEHPPTSHEPVDAASADAGAYLAPGRAVAHALRRPGGEPRERDGYTGRGTALSTKLAAKERADAPTSAWSRG